jgi:hypothetical protein
MKGSKSLRQFINRMRRKYGKKNGNLPRHFFDHPSFEVEDETNKNNYKRHKEKNKRD